MGAQGPREYGLLQEPKRLENVEFSCPPAGVWPFLESYPTPQLMICPGSPRFPQARKEPGVGMGLSASGIQLSYPLWVLSCSVTVVPLSQVSGQNPPLLCR